MSETLESGALTARVSYRQVALTLDPFNTLFDAFRQFGPEGIAIAERLDADGGTLQFASLGATYDPVELAAMKAQGIDSSPAEARRWYEQARKLGAGGMDARIGRLGAR